MANYSGIIVISCLLIGFFLLVIFNSMGDDGMGKS